MEEDVDVALSVSKPRREGTEGVGVSVNKPRSERNRTNRQEEEKKGGCNTVTLHANVEAARCKKPAITWQNKTVEIQDDGEAGETGEITHVARCRSPSGLKKRKD
jgi:hypothetical protein